MAGLCLVGGGKQSFSHGGAQLIYISAIGFIRTRSVPSIGNFMTEQLDLNLTNEYRTVAGTLVGTLYGLAAYRIQNGQTYGYELAAAASVLLFASSVRRFKTGPVPQILTATYVFNLRLLRCDKSDRVPCIQFSTDGSLLWKYNVQIQSRVLITATFTDQGLDSAFE